MRHSVNVYALDTLGKISMYARIHNNTHPKLFAKSVRLVPLVCDVLAERVRHGPDPRDGVGGAGEGLEERTAFVRIPAGEFSS